MPTPKEQASKDGFVEGTSKPSEIDSLKEKETMLLEKAERIKAMDANELQRHGTDISELTSRNQRQLSEVRKEIQRLSK